MAKPGNQFIKIAALSVLVCLVLLVLLFGRKGDNSNSNVGVGESTVPNNTGPRAKPVPFGTESGIAMIHLPAGSVMMGDAKGDPDEKPPHKIWVDSFYMDKYEVTQEEFERLVGENPSRWKGETNPVDRVRWSDAVKYCNARSQEEDLEPCYNLETWECNFNANGYRLPTEAEWEYACRAGTTTKYFFGDGPGRLKQYAWYKKNAAGRTRPVGQKLANPWGLHDMYGNVAEWCNDYYGVDYYKQSVEKNPQGPKIADTRVIRGGSWDSKPEKCRSSFRYNEDPGYADVCFGYDVYGFRVVRKARQSVTGLVQKPLEAKRTTKPAISIRHRGKGSPG